MGEGPFDVLVVGAGPGGSNAAAVCLDRGLRVAQVEAREFPRVKPCAGGLTQKSIAALHYPIGACHPGESDCVSLGSWGSGAQAFHHPAPMLHFVHRPRFDQWLVERNQCQPGFRFFAGEAVLSIEYRGRFVVRTPRRTLTARQLIGADGSYGIVNRLFRLTSPRGSATALEIEVPRDRFVCEATSPRFDFGAVPLGYGWVFPKRDYWSVGLYTLAQKTPELRKTLARYVEDAGFGSANEFEVRGHRYPVGGYRIRVPECPLYLVGDAGGFAEAITGEGIYAALESGRLAGFTAAAVAEGRGEPRLYYRMLRRRVLRDTFLSWKIARIFYRNPAGWLRAFGHPLVWRTIVEGYSEGATLANCVFRSGLYFLRSWRPGVRRTVV